MEIFELTLGGVFASSTALRGKRVVEVSSSDIHKAAAATRAAITRGCLRTIQDALTTRGISVEVAGRPQLQPTDALQHELDTRWKREIHRMVSDLFAYGFVVFATAPDEPTRLIDVRACRLFFVEPHVSRRTWWVEIPGIGAAEQAQLTQQLWIGVADPPDAAGALTSRAMSAWSHVQTVDIATGAYLAAVKALSCPTVFLRKEAGSGQPAPVDLVGMNDQYRLEGDGINAAVEEAGLVGLPVVQPPADQGAALSLQVARRADALGSEIFGGGGEAGKAAETPLPTVAVVKQGFTTVAGPTPSAAPLTEVFRAASQVISVIVGVPNSFQAGSGGEGSTRMGAAFSVSMVLATVAGYRDRVTPLLEFMLLLEEGAALLDEDVRQGVVGTDPAECAAAAAALRFRVKLRMAVDPAQSIELFQLGALSGQQFVDQLAATLRVDPDDLTVPAWPPAPAGASAAAETVSRKRPREEDPEKEVAHAT